MIDDLKRLAINAYTAGIVDGEGCISIRHDKRVGRPEHTYTPRITVVSTNSDVIFWFKDNFGGNVCERKAQKAHWKKQYVWIINSSEAVQLFVERIYKYLIIKKENANVILSFINKDWFDTGEMLYKKMRQLNSGKGVDTDEFGKNARPSEIGASQEVS